EAKSDQAVNTAERNAAHQLLNEVQHSGYPSPQRAAILSIALSHVAILSIALVSSCVDLLCFFAFLFEQSDLKQ
ncbi:MAG: hypothetical protein JZU55_14950, partial [Afipia sp.]|nr:hypothetical protein [Afipia sp.]